MSSSRHGSLHTAISSLNTECRSVMEKAVSSRSVSPVGHGNKLRSIPERSVGAAVIDPRILCIFAEAMNKADMSQSEDDPTSYCGLANTN